VKNCFKKNQATSGLKPDSAGLTDIGLRRSHNEDAIFLSDKEGLYLVADGMGGHLHGEVASAMAIETVSTKFIASDKEKVSFHLKEAIREANERIYGHSREAKPPEGDDTLSGFGNMGTTIVAIALFGETVSVAHVGDSRAYRLRSRHLELLTSDHSLAAIHPLEPSSPIPVPRSKFKHILTRALGAEARVEIDLREERIQIGDLYLLCSDGLTNMLPDARIEEILSSKSSLHSMADTLVKEANENGGRDNISCLLVRPR
jgi:protein phosphatase